MNLLLYTNFIAPTPMGDILSPIIRSIPLKYSAKSAHYRTYEPETIEYYDVSYSELSNLEFTLLDRQGKFIDFVDKTSEINITLNFRPKD